MKSSIETDVLVLGAGAAGSAAALSAREAGYDVILLEVSEATRHTPNFRMAGAWVMSCPDVPAGLEYLRACSGGLVDEDMLHSWAVESRSLFEWLERYGIEMRLSEGIRGPEHPEFPGAETLALRRAWTSLPSPIQGQPGWFAPEQACLGGEALYRGIITAVLNSGAQLFWDSHATSLIIEEGSVTGAKASIHGHEFEIHARGGTVIATGGFGGSSELVQQFIEVPSTEFYGNPFNDGSGMRLGMSAGADLVRMNRFIGRGVGAFDDAESGLRLGFILDLNGGGYLIVDGNGDRYMNESRQANLAHDVLYDMTDFDPASGSYPRSPSYYLFDSARLNAGPLTYPDRGVSTVGLYSWSQDNLKEIASGWIGVGDTPSAAAAAVGANAGHFDEAVTSYNRACDAGTDSFGRPWESLVPLRAPFYCVPLFVGGPHTTGGLRRNGQGQVLAALDGTPITGLYSAGELGQAIGLLYPIQGCSLSEAFCSGIIAGRNAAREAGHI